MKMISESAQLQEMVNLVKEGATSNPLGLELTKEQSIRMEDEARVDLKAEEYGWELLEQMAKLANDPDRDRILEKLVKIKWVGDTNPTSSFNYGHYALAPFTNGFIKAVKIVINDNLRRGISAVVQERIKLNETLNKAKIGQKTE